MKRGCVEFEDPVIVAFRCAFDVELLGAPDQRTGSSVVELA
jgi:hypothetical protein